MSPQEVTTMATTIAKAVADATAVTHAARIEHVSKSFPAAGTTGGQQLVLDDITLDVAPGEFVTLLGHPAAESPHCSTWSRDWTCPPPGRSTRTADPP
jgi:ABC-type polysaccharide/polyol phosphate transport system ATPase subunit